MCLSVFIPISTPLPVTLSPWAGSGWAQAVQQLCPAPGTMGLVLALDRWKFHGVPGTVCLSLQALWVHTALRLLEGPLFPDGHCRSQLAQSWWQGR